MGVKRRLGVNQNLVLSRTRLISAVFVDEEFANLAHGIASMRVIAVHAYMKHMNTLSRSAPAVGCSYFSRADFTEKKAIYSLRTNEYRSGNAMVAHEILTFLNRGCRQRQFAV